MKAVLREFGRTIIAIIILVTLINVLTKMTIDGHTGIFEMVGWKIMDTDSVKESAYQEGPTNAMVEFSNRTKPILTYDSYDINGNWQRIKVRTEVHLLDFLVGIDSDGNSVDNIKVKDIVDFNGNSLIDNYDDTTGNFIFNNPGIYSITCYMKDCENVEAVRKIDIPVDN